MKLIVAGAVSSPCTRAQVAPLCSNFHLTPLTAQQRGIASAHSSAVHLHSDVPCTAKMLPGGSGFLSGLPN